MELESTIARIKAALKARHMPVNDSADPKGAGLHIWEEQHAIYEGKRKKKIVGYKPNGAIGIVYNMPFDGNGHVITYGKEQLYNDTLAVLTELGLRYREAPFGLTVYPS